MNTPDPVPTYFSLRYVLWFILWKHAITTLSMIQIAFGAMLLLADGDPNDPIIPHKVVRYIIVFNSILTAVLAQINRKDPPSLKPASSPA